MKKTVSLLLAACLGASMLLSGCQSTKEPTKTETAAEKAAEETTAAAKEESKAEAESTSEAGTEKASEVAEGVSIRIGSLKGPTSMGLVHMMDLASKGETANSYEFTMAGKADELVGKIANGDLDIALLPANVASILYGKTKGNVAVVDINTLGVLYVVTADSSISSMADLKGKTVYMTGKGTTPEFAMNYLLAENGVEPSEVDFQFKSEATEVVSFLAQDSAAIGVLPQPFATAACIQNEALKPVLDLTEEWNKLNEATGSMMVTGVTLVRRDFLNENEDAVKTFLKEHKASAAFTEEHPDEAAELIAAQGIVEKAPVAKKALPSCNIVCITGQEMKDALTGYLTVLESQDAQSIGQGLPGDDFYYFP